MKRIVTFGEIMGRLTPQGMLRLPQAMPGCLDITFAGAEANVAASLALLGMDARFVTALPNNPIADACVASLRSVGIDTSHLLRKDYGRLGLYFLETGANQRPSRVIYDRDGSTIAQTGPEAYDWGAIFADSDWLHFTGITPAISETAAEATLAAATYARKQGLTISCDLNFRGKLWRWNSQLSPRALAGQTMRRLLSLVDILIANEEDCGDVLDIRADDADVHSGHLNVDRYPDVARRVVEQFPNIKMVATTLRESISASHNNWGAMLLSAEENTVCFEPRDSEMHYQPYEIRNIVDRVGGGDSFAAGLIFGLLHDDYATPADALRFAVAASCLAHSIVGDLNFSSRAEIDALASGSASGRVIR
ncbi:MAG: sugar kinase [Pirellulaceae bacterium]